MDRKDNMSSKEAPVSIPTSAGQLGIRDRQERRLIRNPRVPYSDSHRDPVGFSAAIGKCWLRPVKIVPKQ